MIKVLVLCDDVWHPAEAVIRGLQEFHLSDVTCRGMII